MSIRTTAPAAAVASLTMAAVAVFTVAGNYPTFDGAAEFRDMMVPAGAPVGSLIYRLRASDHDKDYPLYFQATGTYHRQRLFIRFYTGDGEFFDGATKGVVNTFVRFRTARVIARVLKNRRVGGGRGAICLGPGM